MLRYLLLLVLAMYAMADEYPDTSLRLTVCDGEDGQFCDELCRCDQSCTEFLIQSGECFDHGEGLYLKGVCEDNHFIYTAHSYDDCGDVGSEPYNVSLPSCGDSHNFIRCENNRSVGVQVGIIFGIVLGFLIAIVCCGICAYGGLPGMRS